MTPAELDELEKLANAATPGPWEALDNGDAYVVLGDVTDICCPHHAEDMEFIASSREAIPKLIVEVRRLREKNEALQGLARHSDVCGSHEFKRHQAKREFCDCGFEESMK